MNRRNFFRISSLAAAALTFGNLGNTGRLFASEKSKNDFSLELVTDNSSKAIKLAEEFLKNINTGNNTIKYSEYLLEYTESGDLVYFSGGKIINYKTTLSDESAQLKEIAKELGLPKIINKPVRLKFSFGNSKSAAKNFLVFSKNKMIQKISAAENNISITFSSTKGGLTLNVDSGKARVIRSGCTHKNCINSGSISLANDSIVCIPNEIYLIAE
ncbi:MAG: hypothetical protein HOP31_16290 [Ignavibacteria bacterium]|nr:hypothetical protein [Ignavibacteria bacterium]